MEVLIKSATIIDPLSTFNGSVKDIRIVDGIIAEIGDDLTTQSQIIEGDQLHVSPGWFDMRANFRDPGHEYKEDILSGLLAAAAGGFTGVMVMPSTDPPVFNKMGVDYLIQKAAGNAVNVYPAGSVSYGGEGKQLAEMYDMYQAGAVAFTDDKQAIKDPGLMSRALLYAKNFDGLTISFPLDEMMAGEGLMHEGEMSTKLGLKGIPTQAESLQINRDLELLEYTDSKMHIATVSTERGVQLIREAKNKGLRVTAEVAAHNLVIDDEALVEFDSNFKTMPPFRNANEIAALKAGLKDGTIDVICSDHSPEDVENKQLEFNRAAFGIASLETTFSNALAGTKGDLSLEQVVEKMAINPRKILGLAIPEINTGKAANLTVFSPSLEWTPSTENWKSKSNNSPFMGQPLIGKALAICNNNQVLTF